MLRTWQILALLLLLALPASLPAASISNLEREKNWAEQIVDYLVTGEAIRLEANQVKFLALHNQPAGAHKDPHAWCHSAARARHASGLGLH